MSSLVQATESWASWPSGKNWRGPVLEELKAGAQLGGTGAWGSNPVSLTYLVADLFLTGAHDELVALAALLRERSSIHGPMTVARAVLEGSIRAWWILDPLIPVRQRVARAMTERLYDMWHESRVGRELGQQTAADGRTQQILENAEFRGFEVLPGNDRRPPAIEEPWKSNTALVRMLFADSSPESQQGRAVYYDLSAVAHGRIAGIIPGLEAKGLSDDPKGFASSVKGAAVAAIVASFAYERARRRQYDRYGWDLAAWDENAKMTMLSLVSILAEIG